MCCSSMHHWKVATGALPLFRSVIASIVTTNWFLRLACHHIVETYQSSPCSLRHVQCTARRVPLTEHTMR